MTDYRGPNPWFFVSILLAMLIFFGSIGFLIERHDDSLERRDWMKACHHADYEVVINCLERTP